MNLTESVRLSFESLKSNKLRSFLTMLGIIIGISAVITITTIGNSLQKTIASTMRELGGTNLIYAYVNAIMPEFENDAEWERWEYPEMTAKEKLTYEKLSEFQKDFADRVDSVSVEEGLTYSASSTGDKATTKVSVSGVTPGYLNATKLQLLAGRNISDKDNKEMKTTALVSDLYVKYAWGGQNPIGKEISVQLEDDGTVQKFYVVGIYHYDNIKMGSGDPKASERDWVTPILVPYTYVAETNKANGMGNELQSFQVMAKDGEDATKLSQDMAAYFDTKYFSDTGNFELQSYDMASELGQIDQVLKILTIAISVIAAISLIVGGVGVMNIMLVSVVERTREIGIRKALGAKNKSIRRQFMTEAVVICLMGGVIGILIGVLNGFILAQVAGVLVTNYQPDLSGMLNITVSPSISAIVISVVFSMLIGIIFGYYPAKRAANMSPIDALRYE